MYLVQLFFKLIVFIVFFIVFLVVLMVSIKEFIQSFYFLIFCLNHCLIFILLFTSLSFDFQDLIAEPTKLILCQFNLFFDIFLRLFEFIGLDIQKMPQFPELFLIELIIGCFNFDLFDKVLAGENHHAFLIFQLFFHWAFNCSHPKSQTNYLLLEFWDFIIVFFLPFIEFFFLLDKFIFSLL